MADYNLDELADDLNTPRAMAALQKVFDPIVAEIIVGPISSPAKRRPDRHDEDAMMAMFRRARERQVRGDGEGAKRIIDAMTEAGFVVEYWNLPHAGPSLYYGCDWFGAVIDWPAIPDDGDC